MNTQGYYYCEISNVIKVNPKEIFTYFNVFNEVITYSMQNEYIFEDYSKLKQLKQQVSLRI